MKGRGGWDHWYLVSLLRYRSPQLPLTARRVNEVRPAVRLKRSRPESLFSSERLSNTHATDMLSYLFFSCPTGNCSNCELLFRLTPKITFNYHGHPRGGGILKGFGLMFLQLYPSSAKRNWWCFLTDPTDFRLSCFIGKLTPVSTHLILLINPDPWGKKWWFDVCYKSITILQCNTERKWEERLIADKRETILVLLQLSRQLIILSLSVHQQIIFWFDQLIV